MNAANFTACLAIVLASEGSAFVDDPHDPGGATRYGVTLATLSAWRAERGLATTIADVEALTPDTVAPLYEAEFWAPAHCPELPAGVDLMTFDAAVNTGVGRAIRMLQQALGVAADGLFGPQTRAALNQMKPAEIIQNQAADRRAYYRGLPTFNRYGRGWLERVERTEAAALKMAT